MKLNSLTLQQGAAAGGLIVLLQLVAYLLGVEKLLSPWLGTGRFVLVVVAMAMTCMAIRKEEGSLTFKIAFYESWVAAALASLIGVLFMMALVTFDSELATNLLKATKAQLNESMGGFAANMNEEVRQDIEDQTKWMLQPAGQLVGWALGLLLWAIIAAIVGGVFKRPASNSIH